MPEFDRNLEREIAVKRIFTPGSPINQLDLFAGRLEQIEAIVGAIVSVGQHAIVYGERGVGKTSLAHILEAIFQRLGNKNEKFRFFVTNCDTDTEFSALWRRILREIELKVALQEQDNTLDSNSEEKSPILTLAHFLNEAQINPDDIRILFDKQDFSTVIILDEIDRIERQHTRRLLADTIKSLSDHASNVTIILIGVADAVETLIQEHESIERSLIQIHLPRMANGELSEILDKRLSTLELVMDDDAKQAIVMLSKGLPHYVHLLGQHAALECLKSDRNRIISRDVEEAVDNAIRDTNRSVKSRYYSAIRSSRETLYEDVLLSCALSETNDLGYFTASEVKSHLSWLKEKPYEISAFARHLRDFSSKKRANILERVGETRNYQYRFANPLMQPFAVMKGIQNQKIDLEVLTRVLGFDT